MMVEDVAKWTDERYAKSKVLSYDIIPGTLTKRAPGFIQFPMEDTIVIRYRTPEFDGTLDVEEVTYKGFNLFYDIPVKNFSMPEFLSAKHVNDGIPTGGVGNIIFKYYYGVKFYLHSIAFIPFGD